jgi:hypothetical protein
MASARRRMRPALSASLVTTTECSSQGVLMAGCNGCTQSVGTYAHAALVTEARERRMQ